MRIAIVHYHLRLGGVTRIIQHAVSALQQRDFQIVVLSGEAPEQDWPVPVRVVEGLAYEEHRVPLPASALADKLEREACDALHGTPDLWHVHNHSLGKNLSLPGVLHKLASAGNPLLLQMHDFPEDGRPALYRRQRVHLAMTDSLDVSGLLYPLADHIHYAAINSHDRNLLTAAGVPPGQCHLLSNPTQLASPTLAPKPNHSPESRLWLYPTRAIRRKNIGEFLLWAVMAESRDRFATTLGPQNPQEKPVYKHWRSIAEKLALPVDFEIGTRPGVRFEDLLHSAHALITTSVAEGFGMAFLEPWLMDRPVVGRDLPSVTREFREAGIDLPSLYTCLGVPVEWVGHDVIQKKASDALSRLHEAYDWRTEADDLERAMGAWITDDLVDFGHLDEPLQSDVIARIARSSQARQELRPNRLMDDGPDQNLIASNRKAIEERFSLAGYGDALATIYNRIAEAPRTMAMDALDTRNILKAFLRPERLFLIRS